MIITYIYTHIYIDKTGIKLHSHCVLLIKGRQGEQIEDVLLDAVKNNIQQIYFQYVATMLESREGAMWRHVSLGSIYHMYTYYKSINDKVIFICYCIQIKTMFYNELQFE